MTKYLIICPLVFLAGYIDAIGGGGGLISLPAYLMTGLPVHTCLATNKMTAFMGTTVSTGKYARSGFIPWKNALLCIPCAFLGSATGANLALMVDAGLFKMLMLVILPITGAYVLFRKDLNPKETNLTFVQTAVIACVVAFVIGIYDGFYGPGTGTFLILLLTGLAGMQIEKANGLTKAINWTTNLSALSVFLFSGKVLFPLGVIAGLFNVAGNYLGARQFEKGGAKIVRPVIILVLSIFFIKVAVELFAK